MVYFMLKNNRSTTSKNFSFYLIKISSISKHNFDSVISKINELSKKCEKCTKNDRQLISKIIRDLIDTGKHYAEETEQIILQLVLIFHYYP